MTTENPQQQKRKTKPQIPIDWEIVDKLLMAQCSGIMIAAYFGVNEDTLYNRCKSEKGVGFSAYSISKKDKGKAVAMMKHFNRVIKESDRAIEKFGEQHLGWTTKIDQKISGDINVSQIEIIRIPSNGKQQFSSQEVSGSSSGAAN